MLSDEETHVQSSVLRKIEVCQLHERHPIRVPHEQQVRRLDIPDEHADFFVMAVVEHKDKLLEDETGCSLWQPTSVLGELEQVSSVGVLHHEAQIVLGGNEAAELYDVGMEQFPATETHASNEGCNLGRH